MFLPEVIMEADNLRRDEPSALRPTEGSSIDDIKGKSVVEEGYETSSDVDVDEVRMMGDGLLD